MSDDDLKKEILEKITTLEQQMLAPDFWQDSALAQEKIAQLQDLKDELESGDKYAKNSAIVTIYAGAGGEDAEDWVRMLLNMYMKFVEKKTAAGKKMQINFLDENQNPNGGYRSVTFEIDGKGVYGALKNESGVHRLVRKSPFNSAGKRQTSFAMVEVIPKFSEEQNRKDLQINPDELRIEFTKSSGPGGQNVNKRETAVRVMHEPTGVTAFVSSQRNQAQNKEVALEMVYGKIHELREKQRRGEIAELKISTDTQAQWGSQIRSYVLHPYKLVKDHRTDVETSSVDDVLNGEIDLFIE
jgi:peptide chain release factor 2